MPRKRGMGRKKIEIKRIDNEAARLVTFSKRRLGLFNKGNDLSILCGAEVVVVVFSSAGKVYTYGHPSVNSVVDKFLAQNNTPGEGVPQIMDTFPGRTLVVHQLSQVIDELRRKLKQEKMRGEILQHEEETHQGGPWWLQPIENMDLRMLMHLMNSMGDFKNNAISKVNRGRVPVTLPTLAGSSIQAADPLGAISVANNNDLVPYGYAIEGGHF